MLWPSYTPETRDQWPPIGGDQNGGGGAYNQSINNGWFPSGCRRTIQDTHTHTHTHTHTRRGQGLHNTLALCWSILLINQTDTGCCTKDCQSPPLHSTPPSLFSISASGLLLSSFASLHLSQHAQGIKEHRQCSHRLRKIKQTWDLKDEKRESTYEYIYIYTYIYSIYKRQRVWETVELRDSTSEAPVPLPGAQ